MHAYPDRFEMVDFTSRQQSTRRIFHMRDEGTEFTSENSYKLFGKVYVITKLLINTYNFLQLFDLN